jgi:hypothetical protein
MRLIRVKRVLREIAKFLPTVCHSHHKLLESHNSILWESAGSSALKRRPQPPIPARLMPRDATSEADGIQIPMDFHRRPIRASELGRSNAHRAPAPFPSFRATSRANIAVNVQAARSRPGCPRRPTGGSWETAVAAFERTRRVATARPRIGERTDDPR